MEYETADWMKEDFARAEDARLARELEDEREARRVNAEAQAAYAKADRDRAAGNRTK